MTQRIRVAVMFASVVVITSASLSEQSLQLHSQCSMVDGENKRSGWTRIHDLLSID